MISTECFLQGKEAQAKGYLDQAIQYYEEVLETNRSALGEYHPDVAFIKNSLGTVWFKKGDFKRAIDYMEETLKSLHKICASDHPMLGQACQNLGMAWSYNGNEDKAIQYYEKALFIYKRAGMGDKTSVLQNKINRLFDRLKKQVI
jgi:tetratricopeptide (TPR) repeat protein